MSLLALNLVATLAAAPDLHTKASLLPIPIGATVGVETRLTPQNLTVAAEATWMGLSRLHPTAWTAWGHWSPLAWNCHSLGPMVGYSQSYLVRPRAGLGGSPYDSPALLVGLAYEWTSGPWSFRTVPHVGWDMEQGYYQSLMGLQSLLFGPPLVEVSWRPSPHIEWGLRSSITPLRFSVTF